jgi:hypothetical protein
MISGGRQLVRRKSRTTPDCPNKTWPAWGSSRMVACTASRFLPGRWLVKDGTIVTLAICGLGPKTIAVITDFTR